MYILMSTTIFTTPNILQGVLAEQDGNKNEKSKCWKRSMNKSHILKNGSQLQTLQESEILITTKILGLQNLCVFGSKYIPVKTGAAL